jgi:hypothetical protein
MPNVKVQCSFCGKTNAKMEADYAPSGFLGLSSTKVGEHEVIDSNADDFFRCVGCGRIYCAEHHVSLCFKKDIGWITTKKWFECPKCTSKQIVKI